MKRFLIWTINIVWLTAWSGRPLWADTTPITAGLNAPVIGDTGGSRVFWGPIVSQTSLSSKGNTNTNYPVKYAGTFISGSGGSAGSFQSCVNPSDPMQGPGNTPPYAWFCD